MREAQLRDSLDWYWRFRLLYAAILVEDSQKREAAAQELAEAPPDEPRLLEHRIRHTFLLGELARRHRDSKADELLGLSRRLAHEHGFPGLEAEIAIRQASLWRQLSVRHPDQGHFERALEALRSAARLTEDPYDQGRALSNLGFYLFTNQRWDEAVQALERAWVPAQEASNDPLTIAILLNLGTAYNRLGEQDKARDYLLQVLEIAERNRFDDDLQRAWGEIGNNYFFRDSPLEAIPYYEKAYKLALQVGETRDSSKWSGNLASALLLSEQWDQAERLNQEAWELKEKANDQVGFGYLMLTRGLIAAGRGRSEEALSEMDKLLSLIDKHPDELRTLRWETHASIGVILSRREERQSADRHFSKALEYIEMARDSLSQDDSQISFLARSIRFYQAYVSNLLRQNRSEEALHVAESSRALVLSERLESNGIPDALLDYASLRRAARRRGVVFLSYWLTPNGSGVWAVGPGQARYFPLDGNLQWISSQVQIYRKLVEEQVRETADHPVGRELSRILLEPVADLLPAGSKVVIVPDGPLHGLNFETLPAPGADHYWIEEVTVAIAPSLGLVVQSPVPGRPSRAALIIGDPSPPQGSGFQRLTHSIDEISAIQRHLSDWSTTMRIGGEASPQAFVEAVDSGSYQWIHFSAHAYANRQSPLDSAVVLSPNPASDSYKLYARDLLELRSGALSTDLVTLSSCYSAGAKSYSGEGLVGFAWAFLRAGARNVVGGLWEVTDRSTPLLMDSFYRNLSAGLLPEEALRQAKLDLMRSSKVFQKPYYWAPFQLYVR